MINSKIPLRSRSGTKEPRRSFGGPSEVLRRDVKIASFPQCFQRFSILEVLRRSFGGPSGKTEMLQIPNFPQDFQHFLGSGGSSEVLRRSFRKNEKSSNPPFPPGISTIPRLRRFFGGPSEVLRKKQRSFKSSIYPRNFNVF